MKFLLASQNPDGSFRNLGATIYVMQSLVGALPYDVNKITCPENETGKKIKRGPATVEIACLEMSILDFVSQLLKNLSLELGCWDLLISSTVC